MADEYIIPLGIDPKNFNTGLDQMEAGLNSLTSMAKDAGANLSTTFVNSAQAGDALITKMNATAGAAKALSDAAKSAGVSIDAAFNGAGGKAVDGLTNKIVAFQAKLKDMSGKPVDFKFNIDQARLNILADQLKLVTGQTETFNLALAAAKERLGTLAVGSDAFNELDTQIAAADEFLNQLGTTVGETAEKHVSLRAQIRAVKQELADMTLAGLDGTAAFFKLQEEAAHLTHAMTETNKQVANLASNEKYFKAGTDTVKLFTGSLFAASGALTLLGTDNEELKKKEEQLMGAVFLLNGAMEVYSALSKESTLSALILNKVRGASKIAAAEEAVAVEAETVALGEEVVVKTGFIAATKAAAVASYEFTAALLTNPLTAIVVVLAAAAAGLIYWLNIEKEAVTISKEFVEVLDVEIGVLEKVAGIISDNAKLKLAQADKDQEDASKKTEILIEQQKMEIEINKQTLESAKTLYEAEQEALKKKLYEGSLTAKEWNEQQKAADDAYNKEVLKLKKENEEKTAAIEVETINREKQLADEENKLENDKLHQLIANAAAANAIRQETKKYAQEILSAQNSDLKDGKAKDLEVLNESIKEQVEALNRETELKKEALANQKKQLTLDEYNDDPEVFALKKKGLEQQEDLEVAATKKRTALKNQLIQSGAIEAEKIEQKYNQQIADNEYNINSKMLALEKESAAQKIAVLNATAEHEIELVNRSSLTGDQKFRQSLAIELQLQKDTAAAELQGAMDQIDLQALTNKNIIEEMTIFAHNAVKNTRAKNILILQEEANAANQKLDLLYKSGLDEKDLVVQQAKAIANAAQDALKKASVNAKNGKSTWAELLGLGDNPDEQRAINEAIADGMKAVQSLSNNLTQTLINNAQKQVNAAKQKVSADDSALSDLHAQLSTEMALRDKGVANNVDGINKEIAAKETQRTKDLAAQDAYQKKMEKIQRAQILVNSLEEASALTLAIAKIYANDAALGPAGPAIATAIAVVMIAAFLAEKAAALSAVGSTTTMAEGGIIKGKSHSQGGQKYFAPDGSGNVVELEADEFVTKKEQTQRFLPLLQAINNNEITSMPESKLIEMLAGTGVHLQTDRTLNEGLRESREHTAGEITNNIVIPGANTPKELAIISDNVQRLVDGQNQKEYSYEEGNYIVQVKGNKTIRIRKK